MGIGGTTLVEKTTSYEHLLDPRRKWYNNRRLIALNGWITLLLITSTTSGYDGSMLNGLQSLPIWEADFNNPRGSKLGLLGAIQNIGSLGCLPFAPYCADLFGRRRTVGIGAALMVIATVIQTASQSVGMFIGARFLIGFGLGFAAMGAPLLISELSYPTYRAPLTSMYNSLWQSGAIIAAWVTFGTFKLNNSWSWRSPSAFQGLSSLIQVFTVWFCPESPRWLINRGREQEALGILAYYHADGNEEDPLVKYEFEEIKSAIELDRTVNANIGWKSLVATPGNRRRMRIIIAIAFFSQWSGNGLVSYYLNKVFDVIGITDPTIQLLINGLLSIWNLCWAMFGAVICDKAGRRPLFLIATTGMGVSFMMQTVCSAQFALHGNHNAAHAVIAFIFIYSVFYDLAFSPLIVTYTVEILPYPLRAKGLTVFNFSISVSLVFNQYINPIALGAISWKYYIVYVCWIACELAFLYFFLVETKNRTLEETAILFDGEEATEKLAENALQHAHITDVREDDLDEKSEGKSATINEVMPVVV